MVPNDNSVFGVGRTPAEVAQVLAAAGAPTDKITLGVDALLVQGRGRVMLFDTGLGPRVRGQVVASLALAGLTPDRVTDIFITHSHFDHVGGLVTLDGHSTFPKAVIHMSSEEWGFMSAQPSNADLVKVIAVQVKPFLPGGVVSPGVRSVALVGHTPGHTGYDISSGGAHLIDIGDSAHSAIISLAKPDWDIEYDQDFTAGPRHPPRDPHAPRRKPRMGLRAPFPFSRRGQSRGEGRRLRLGAGEAVTADLA